MDLELKRLAKGMLKGNAAVSRGCRKCILIFCYQIKIVNST